jgi:predicted secreted hydrolase
MRGASGRDHLEAGLSAAEAGPAGQAAAFGLALDLATDRPAVLHDRIGFIDFGPVGGSYYYSRPRMAASGTLQLDGSTLHVTGDAWFDHQWGDFIAVGGGGWDWFAVNLADGTDLTLSLVRDASGGHPLVYGTLVHPDGTFDHLDRDAFTVDTLGTWTSPRSSAVYPAGWRIRVPAAALEIMLEPAVPDQELDTRSTTGVIYWEGSQRVSATKQGRAVAGEAYVELTGYAATPAALP